MDFHYRNGDDVRSVYKCCIVKKGDCKTPAAKPIRHRFSMPIPGIIVYSCSFAYVSFKQHKMNRFVYFDNYILTGATFVVLQPGDKQIIDAGSY